MTLDYEGGPRVDACITYRTFHSTGEGIIMRDGVWIDSSLHT